MRKEIQFTFDHMYPSFGSRDRCETGKRAKPGTIRNNEELFMQNHWRAMLGASIRRFLLSLSSFELGDFLKLILCVVLGCKIWAFFCFWPRKLRLCEPLSRGLPPPPLCQYLTNKSSKVKFLRLLQHDNRYCIEMICACLFCDCAKCSSKMGVG